MGMYLSMYVGVAIVAPRLEGSVDKIEWKCPNGHRSVPTHRFCPDCGEKLVEVKVPQVRAFTIESLIRDSDNDYEDWFFNAALWNKDDDITAIDVLIPNSSGHYGSWEHDEMFELDITKFSTPELISEFEKEFAIFLAEMRQSIPNIEVKAVAVSWYS